MGAKQYTKDSLGNRMKGYEDIPKNSLMLGVPHIVRLDMRAGHSFCRDLARPFDAVFSKCMESTAEFLAREVPGCAIAYTQSDEISLVLFDSFANGYNCFFDGAVEKIVSVTASMATLEFNRAFHETVTAMTSEDSDESALAFPSDSTVVLAEGYAQKLFKATFDSRVFSVPSCIEVANYLIWRTQDATRNSVNMLAQSVFPHQQLQGKNLAVTKDMLLSVGRDWNDVPPRYRHGVFFLARTTKDDAGKLRKVWRRSEGSFSGTDWYGEMIEFLGESIHYNEEG